MSNERTISADEARALRDAATPGPWVHYGHDDADEAYITQLNAPEEDIALVMDTTEADGDLMASAPALCDTVIALHAEVARLTEALRRSREAHALDLHAVMEYLTPGAAPAEVSGDAVIEAARAMREAIDGRTTPPTDEEIAAHRAAGGEWIVWSPEDGAWVLDASTPEDVAIGRRYAVRWTAIIDGRPCPWPVVGGAR